MVRAFHHIAKHLQNGRRDCSLPVCGFSVGHAEIVRFLRRKSCPRTYATMSTFWGKDVAHNVIHRVQCTIHRT